MSKKTTTSTSSEEQKVFGIRGFDPRFIKAIKILSLKEERSVKDLMEEATKDLLKKYKEPF